MTCRKIVSLFTAMFMLLFCICSFAEMTEDSFSAETVTAVETEKTEELNNEPVIVQRNADVLDAVYASCQYGIHARGVENYRKKLSMLVTTDIHGAWTRLDEAVRYLNAVPSLDCGCCLGDIMPNNFIEDSEPYNQAVATSEKPWFTVIGNHDCGNSDDPEKCGTTEEVVSKFITPNEAKAGQHDLSVPYYYYDWDMYGIRMIVLYNYESPLRQRDGKYIYRRGDDCYDQKQLDWFIETLNSTPPEYSVVVLQHSQPETNFRDDNNFSQPWTITYGEGTGGYDQVSIKGDIVDAWIHGTKIEKKYMPEAQYGGLLPEIEVSADFTSRGPGTFICYLVGHVHADVVTRLKEHPDQLTICFASTSADLWQNGGSDLPRVEGDRSEDAITVVSFDTSSRRINLVRVGSAKTIYMVDRTMVSIPYASN